MFCLSVILHLNCSLTHKVPKIPTDNPINPEIQLSPVLRSQPSLKKIQAVLDAPLNESSRVILDVLKSSGYSIQEASIKEDRINTVGKQFVGPAYPWMESYSIRITSVNDNRTLIKVLRQVKIYRPIFLAGPHIWMSRSSNGQREKRLIEQIEQRLRNGVTGHEK